MVKVGLSLFGTLLLVLGAGAAFAADGMSADPVAAPAAQASIDTAEAQCGATLPSNVVTFVNEIDGIKYSHMEICSCRTDADCDDVCGEEGGVCKILDTVPCPPPMPPGSCLCGAEQTRPQRLSSGLSDGGPGTD